MELRDRSLDELKSPENEVILFLGDSFIAGLQVELEDTAPKQLEALLNEKGSMRFSVVNAAVSSYSPVLEYLQLMRLEPLFKPNTVILGLWINDFGGDSGLLKSPEALFDAKGIVRSIEGQERPPVGFLYQHLYLYHFVGDMGIRLKNGGAALLCRLGLKEIFRSRFDVDRWEKEEGEDYLQSSLRSKENKDATFSYLRIINDECRENGMRFLVVILPQPNQVGRDQVRPGWHSIWYSPPEYIESTYYQDIVKAFCQAEGIPCQDLLPAFRAADRSGAQLHFPSNGHWNEEGHRLAAEEIRKALADRGWVPPTAERPPLGNETPIDSASATENPLTRAMP